jgi:DNA-binding Lrp family transcriptional regulator
LPGLSIPAKGADATVNKLLFVREKPSLPSLFDRRARGSGCYTPSSPFANALGAERRTRRQSVADVQAYILIQTEVGKAAQVAKEVRSIDGVDAAEDVTGPYDVIVRASASNVDDLGKLVVAKIQAVEGITRTLTCPVVHL